MFEIKDEDMNDNIVHIHDQKNLNELIDALLKVINSAALFLDTELDNINDSGC